MITPATAPTARADAGVYPADGTTFVVPLPEDAFYESTSGRLSLSHDGQHWGGTFRVVLASLLRDLLGEGPVNVVLSTTDTVHAAGERMTRISGVAIALEDDEYLTFEDGFTIALSTVLAIEC